MGKLTASYLLCIESSSSAQNDASALAPKVKDRRPRPQMDSTGSILRRTWSVAARPTSPRRAVLPWAAGKVVPLSAIDRRNEHLSIKNVVLCWKINRQSIKNGITYVTVALLFRRYCCSPMMLRVTLCCGILECRGESWASPTSRTRTSSPGCRTSTVSPAPSAAV